MTFPIRQIVFQLRQRLVFLTDPLCMGLKSHTHSVDIVLMNSVFVFPYCNDPRLFHPIDLYPFPFFILNCFIRFNLCLEFGHISWLETLELVVLGFTETLCPSERRHFISMAIFWCATHKACVSWQHGCQFDMSRSQLAETGKRNLHLGEITMEFLIDIYSRFFPDFSPVKIMIFGQNPTKQKKSEYGTLNCPLWIFDNSWIYM